MPSTKTDNSHAQEKTGLRAECSPPGDLRVLDAFGGRGIIWENVGKERNIARYVAIEKDRKKNPAAIHGDNRKLLGQIDLSGFNVIDLDDYGMPVKQLEMVFQNRTLQKGTVIFATCILALRGSFPLSLAKYMNCTPSMIKKCKYLFVTRMKEALKGLLASHGVKEWTYYEYEEKMTKIYCAFKV